MSAAHATRLKPVRRAAPCASDVSPASARVFSSRSSADAGYSILNLPVSNPVIAIAKLVGAHDSVEDPAELFTRLVVDRAKAIGIAHLTDSAIPCEAEKGRQGMPLGALPLPQEGRR